MANRISLLCLGGTLAPYSTANIAAPQLPNGGVSEYISFGVDQLQRNYDTTTAQQTAFPFALSGITVKFVDANHFRTAFYFLGQNQTEVNNLANA